MIILDLYFTRYYSIPPELEEKLLDFKKNKKDKHSNTGLSKLITRRKKLLDYLNKKEPTIYKKVIEQLGLRK